MVKTSYDEWKEWYPKVYGYFYKRVGNKSDVEDLTAETMNTVFMAENVLNFRAYMWRVAHNYLIKYIDSKAKKPIIVSFDEEIDTDSTVHNSIDLELDNQRSQVYTQKKEELLRCIKKQLKKEDKDIISLSIIQEKNSTEISKIINISATNVRKKLSRAIKKVKEMCKDLWFVNNTSLR